ncbi:DnaD domain protein [Limosilactobacillus sp. STM2_1]|uniref:DnaD domain protein n=1 Tax=Limosilactobacillus rudii TaxID=2759755 RepID=A0A7W3YLY0_9LACO|nr:DnaD domain protein [Limosilactobacillus rudii]MBB1080212.1 DnaD domain protein [Limosilactobacillus rudii]MBB1096884.1 DnaD domain protein [Limosilactobacillus rudii]MCD7133782.1 DnaD domain protein [Limosilactobacillus rudii]
MSKLLIDERPLQCQPSLAVALGSADEAIVFQQLHYWLQRTTRVQSDGNKWVYNSMAEWLKQFPWIKSRSTLSRYFDDLEKRGLIITGNFNKAKFDKTKWYRIDYQALSDFEQRLYQNKSTSDQESDNGASNNGTCSDQESDNGMSDNESTNTNRLPSDYQETTSSTKDDDEPVHEDPFTLASQANINVNSGLHLPVFVEFVQVLGKPVVCWAIRKTADNAAHPNWQYLQTVLKNLEANSVRTVEQAEQLSEKHRQEQKPKQHYSSYGNKRPPINEPIPEWYKREQERKKQGKSDQGNWMDQLPDKSEVPMPDD